MASDSGMTVLFYGNSSNNEVYAVYWEDDAGEVHERILSTDGKVSEHHIPGYSLYLAAIESGLYTQTMAATVDDLRSAFQYLGKSFDLVETLPEADLEPHEITYATS